MYWLCAFAYVLVCVCGLRWIPAYMYVSGECMYVCMYVCVYVYVCICKYLHLDEHKIYFRINICINQGVHKCVCLCVRTFWRASV